MEEAGNIHVGVSNSGRAERYTDNSRPHGRETMPTREITTHSAEETTALGRELAPWLEPPKLVLLRGDLGAGKTTLVKGIAAG